jgi:hypothetical protein
MLTELMIRYEGLKKACDALEASIKEEILKLGKSQSVGNVKATFTKGRKTINYQAIAEPLAPIEIVDKYTSKKVDWRKVFGEIDAENDIIEANTTIGDPSVSIKIVA